MLLLCAIIYMYEGPYSEKWLWDIFDTSFIPFEIVLYWEHQKVWRDNTIRGIGKVQHW